MLHHPSIVARVARRLIFTEQSVDAIGARPDSQT